ncbi:phosphatase PAP2 family protein [Streptomyces sp. NPDC007369]|uniref:phosphatase PAP2 family protein n=1 Tax=Streptomyces sp. NPDC007369 TaxID=3154589 RepID=UPI0033FD726A
MRRSGRVWQVGIGCTLLAALLTALVAARWQPLLRLDALVARDLHASAVADPGFTELMRVLTDWVWDPWTMRALAVSACVWLWLRGDRPRAMRVAAVTVAAAVVSQGMKAAVGRDRPLWPDPVDAAHYAAFPSGHAMTAAAVCGMLLWLLPPSAHKAWARGAWVLASVSVLGVGFTRVYLGVHWPSDVLAGWLLGVALAALAIVWPGRRKRPEAAAR